MEDQDVCFLFYDFFLVVVVVFVVWVLFIISRDSGQIIWWYDSLSLSLLCPYATLPLESLRIRHFIRDPQKMLFRFLFCLTLPIFLFILFANGRGRVGDSIIAQAKKAIVLTTNRPVTKRIQPMDTHTQTDRQSPSSSFSAFRSFLSFFLLIFWSDPARRRT